MSRSTLIRHRPGTILGHRRDGRPIFPIAGGSEPPNNPPADPPKNDPPKNDPPAGPAMAKDEHGNDLGFPVSTAVAEMKPEQQAAYWRNESKKQQKAREDAERKLQAHSQSPNGNGSGTVTDQQTQNDSAAAVAAAREAGKREGATGAAIAAITIALQTRGKSAEDITELLGVVDPAKFLTDALEVDTTRVANYVHKVAPAGNGAGGLPGQGRQEQQSQSKAEAGKAEAQRRGWVKNDAQRGALGGLRK